MSARLVPGPVGATSVHHVPRRSDVRRRQHELYGDRLPARPVRQQQHLHPLPSRHFLFRRRGHTVHAMSSGQRCKPPGRKHLYPLRSRDLRRHRGLDLLPAMRAELIYIHIRQQRLYPVSRRYRRTGRQFRLHDNLLPARPVSQQRHLFELSARNVLGGRERNRMYSLRNRFFQLERRKHHLHAVRSRFVQFKHGKQRLHSVPFGFSLE
jgi:hypothetical protein